ncbi:Mnt [Carabus blaptoides fortunei]
MSLETLLEAARTHAALQAGHPLLSQSPPAALVPVSLVQAPPHTHSLEVISPTSSTMTLAPPRTPGPSPQLPQASVTLATNQQQVIEIVTKPQPITVAPPQPVQPVVSNGFEKPAALVIDENQPGTDLKKRVHVPSVMRSGTREVHNKLEKNRRAHLKECFELLKKHLPPQQDEKKSSNLSILHSALRYIQVLKKKERENEHEMERLAREKIAAQQRLAALKKELGAQWDNIDFSSLLPEQNVTTTTGPLVHIKEERAEDTIRLATTTTTATTTLQPAQLSVHLPLPQVGYPVSQGLVVGLQKIALVSKNLPLVSSPVTHIITAPPQLNGKVVPLMNAQYLMKPVVVVSTPSAANTPRPS